MANNIAEYDAKIYFWGMVLFATVSFIALPTIAYIFMDNQTLSQEIKEDRRETKRLKKQVEELLKGKKDGNDKKRDGDPD